MIIDMLIDTTNQTVKMPRMSSKGESITMPLHVLKEITWMLSEDKKFVVMVIDASNATIKGSEVTINNGAKCMSYSTEFIASMAEAKKLNDWSKNEVAKAFGVPACYLQK